MQLRRGAAPPAKSKTPGWPNPGSPPTQNAKYRGCPDNTRCYRGSELMLFKMCLPPEVRPLVEAAHVLLLGPQGPL